VGHLGYFLISVSVLVIDRASKYLVSYFYDKGSLIFFRTGFFSLRYVENPGGAFGVFPKRSSLFILVTFIAVGLVAYILFFSNLNQAIIKIGLALLLGGSSGNLIDRIVNGAVIDFIQFGNTPIFNVADIAIVAGTGLIIFGMLGGTGLIEN